VVEESKSKEKIKRNGNRYKDLDDEASASETEYDFVTPKITTNNNTSYGGEQ
jgi:hypothetical protein